MNNLLEIKHLQKQFPQKNNKLFRKKEYFTALDDVNLEIKKGEILGLVGESGSGKSTLGRMIMGLTSSSSGSIKYNGEEISQLTDKEKIPYYLKMQMIFQDSTSSLNPRKTIGEQITAPMLRLGVVSSKQEAEKESIELLKKVGLKSEHIYRYPHEFSGGQRQRIGIARALALKPEFLVLDEPTSALDVSIQAQILNLLLDIQEEFNLTYLFIGHNLSVIKFFCHRVAVLYKGKIVEIAKSDELYSKPFHPISNMLLKSVLKLERQEESSNLEETLESTDMHTGCSFSGKCNYASAKCYESHPQTTIQYYSGIERSYACYHPLNQETKELEVVFP
ncbi:oligopeptide/dipeptide ABC transporter ATP-binding protein [Peribacillus kribbensis]|uniref:oligopeptide/dipeptide ABC transporter ATP-binding protein n=1 Tax=Peribacillus kribbensis TaxID=356658 RepID=UPI0004241C65|nr:ABC transporter ATP-binding protein [Peribacillus kribbensis]